MKTWGLKYGCSNNYLSSSGVGGISAITFITLDPFFESSKIFLIISSVGFYGKPVNFKPSARQVW